MGYQITTPEVAYWVPNCFWAIPHPFGVTPEVCALLGIAELVLCPLKVWQLHRSRPLAMGPSQAGDHDPGPCLVKLLNFRGVQHRPGNT